jgi:hypothetical protein
MMTLGGEVSWRSVMKVERCKEELRRIKKREI